MGFFERLRNLWQGWMGGLVRDAEASNPKAVFDAAIQQRKKQRDDLIKAVSNIVYLRNRTADELSALEQERTQIEAQLKATVQADDDDASLALLTREEEIDARTAELHQELTRVSHQADEAKAGLEELEKAIKKLQREKDEVLAARETANARISVQNALSDLSVAADVEALESVRQSVKKLQAEADIRTEINPQGQDAALARAQKLAQTASAIEKLAQLKARHAQEAEQEAPVPQPEVEVAVADGSVKKTM